MWIFFNQLGDLGNAGPPKTNEPPLFRTYDVLPNRRFSRSAGTKSGGAGGMSGTASKMSLDTILLEFRGSVHGEEWEMVDIGAGSGVVVAMSLTYGASLAVGVELKNEGKDAIFESALKRLEEFGVSTSCASIQFGVDIITCKVLPTLQTPERTMHKAVFAFCDGFSEPDRGHIFGLIGRDSLVCVFMCSCGKGKRDKYKKPSSVLEALNASARSLGTRLFSLRSPVPSFKVAMFDSGYVKTLHVFVRQL